MGQPCGAELLLHIPVTPVGAGYTTTVLVPNGIFVFPAAPARADREENHFPGPQRPGGHGQVSGVAVTSLPSATKGTWALPVQLIAEGKTLEFIWRKAFWH